jgi:hypothetical protein
MVTLSADTLCRAEPSGFTRTRMLIWKSRISSSLTHAQRRTTFNEKMPINHAFLVYIFVCVINVSQVCQIHPRLRSCIFFVSHLLYFHNSNTFSPLSQVQNLNLVLDRRCCAFQSNHPRNLQLNTAETLLEMCHHVPYWLTVFLSCSITNVQRRRLWRLCG